jgi:hypothetical protein
METSVPVIDKHYGHPRHQPAAECWQAYLSQDARARVLLPEWAGREFGDESAEEAARRQPLRR